MDRFASTGIPKAGRKAGYESAMRAYFGDDYSDKDVRVDIDRPDEFSASMEPFKLGSLSGGIHVNNAPHSIFLAPIDRHCGDLDFYLMMNGDVTFDVDQGPVQLRSGDMALLRTADPVSSFSNQMDMVALHIPERLLRRRLDSRPLVVGQAVTRQAGLARCLGALLRAAADRADPLTHEEGLLFQSAIIDAVMQVSRADADGPCEQPLPPDEKARLIMRTALTRLQDPALSPQALAEETGLSVRTVHRLFHGTGCTFRDWIREKRLERCWEELSDPTPGRRTVAEVAFKWGFNDLTTFNRSFRAKYGIPPMAVRSR